MPPGEVSGRQAIGVGREKQGELSRRQGVGGQVSQQVGSHTGHSIVVLKAVEEIACLEQLADSLHPGVWRRGGKQSGCSSPPSSLVRLEPV